jgi:hypothetical protein
MRFPGIKASVVLLSTVAAAAVASLSSVTAQTSVPNISGVFAREAHNYPKPYAAPGRGGGIRDGYNNDILKPWVVELLNRDTLVTRSGQAVTNPHMNCYPESVPAVFGGAVIQILQTPTEITWIFADPGQYRTVRLNSQHPEQVVPSYWGDSIGHWEGDTLVVDTVGIAVKPQSGSMGNYGTPHSEALHLVERWRFLRDGEVSTAPPAENDSFDAAAVVPGAKHLRVTFTLDDPIAYRKPWSVTLDYMPLIGVRVREYVCAENARNPQVSPFLPTADTPDF